MKLKKVLKPNYIKTDFGVLNMVPLQSEIIHSNEIEVGIYKIYPSVNYPKYSTKNSACFDVSAFIGEEINFVEVFTSTLLSIQRPIRKIPEKEWKRGINLEPGESAFIPTGIIFDIPEGYKILFYPRSGLAGKFHLKLSNCVGVIDSDYINETMILLKNDSNCRQTIADGERLMQGEIVPILQTKFYNCEKPLKKSNRNGGMGSTGI